MVYQVEPVPAGVGCAAGVRCEDVVEITYLGVAGFLIRHGGTIVLTAPSFTNPPLEEVAPAYFRVFRRAAPRIHPDTLAIERLLPAAADSASLLLVGHGHYDHLLDVPYVATRRAVRATLYGGPSVRHMLMGDSVLRAHPERVVAVDSADAGSATRAGRWFYDADSSVRVMALVADHAPTLRLFRQGQMFAAGVVREDRSSLPARAGDWKLGEPYAWLIDVMDSRGTTVVFRLFYQDAAADARFDVLPPLPEGDRRPVDVAIVCVGNYGNVREYPDALVRAVAPRFVVLGHWEDFFRSSAAPAQVIRFTNTSRLGARLDSLAPSRYAALDRKVPLTFVY